MRRIGRVALLAAVVVVASPAAASAAEQWLPPRTAETLPTGQSFESDVETLFDTDGTLVIVVRRHDSGQGSYLNYAYLRPPGGEFTVTKLSDDNVAITNVVVDPRGGVAVAWLAGGGINIRRRPPGGEFGPVETINTVLTDPFFDWAIAPDGRETFVFQHTYGANRARLVAISRPGAGVLFDNEEVVSPNTMDANQGRAIGQRIAIAPTGAAAIAYQYAPVDPGSTFSVRVARRAPGAEDFSASEEVAPASQGASSAEVAFDAAGRPTLVYTSVASGRRARVTNAPANSGSFGAVQILSPDNPAPNHNFAYLDVAPDGSAVIGFGGGGSDDQWATRRGPSPPAPGAPQSFETPMRIDGGFANLGVPEVAIAEDGVAYVALWSGSAGAMDMDGWRSAGPGEPFLRTRLAEDGAGGDGGEFGVGSEGNAAIVYKGDQQRTLVVVPYDDEPPTVSLTGPGTLLTNTAGDFLAAPFDYWGPVTTAISHDDGQVGTPHAFATPGTYTSTATVTDAAGFTASATTETSVTDPPPEQPPPGPPVITPQPQPGTTLPTARQVIRLPSNRRCVSRRRFRIRLRRPNGLRIASAVVRVNGKRVKTVRGARVTALIDLRGLPKGRVRVRIVVTTSTGRKLRATRTYLTCATKRRRGRVPRIR